MGKLLQMALLTLGLQAMASSSAQDAQSPPARPSRYPLRLHVLAIDDTHKTPRMQPNWCSLTVADVGGNPGTAAGGTDPCSNSGSLSFGGDDDFTGAGRADLVTLPNFSTQALSFNYDGCSRVRVLAGFQGLQARWKKPGRKLEVLIPTDAITSAGRPIPTEKCTLTVTLRDFVYLRLRSGALLEVTRDAYSSKPALRAFLSGGAQTLETRSPPVVSVKELEKPNQQ